MDNNFNQQQVPQNQQPVYQQPQQPVYQQPQQPVYQQAPQNQQPVYQQPQQPMYQQQTPKQPPKFNLMELIAFICSAVGVVMAVLGATLTCSCSASKTFESGSSGYSLSAVFIDTIFGVFIAVAGVVLAIVALKQKNAPVKAGKLAYVSMVIGVFATLYGLIPTFTICGYNCSLDNAVEDYLEEKQTQTYDYSSYINY